MALKAGTVQQFDDDSMAAAMENALEKEWRRFKGFGLPDGYMQVYWRMLFVAIAQGVVWHLKEQLGDSLSIDVDVQQMIEGVEGTGVEDGDGPKPAIESRNPERIRVRSLDNYDTDGFGTGYGYYGNLGILAERDAGDDPAIFVQKTDPTNLVWSEGEGSVVAVKTDGELYEPEEGGV